MKKAETPSLTYSPRNAWDVYTTATQKRQMDALVKRYMDFLSNCKTERETVAYVQKRLQEAGFSEDFKKNAVFRNLRGKAIFAARKGKIPLQKGVHLIAAHADSPRLDFKQRPLVEQPGVAQAKTHYYGGIRKYQWVTIPLELRGVVALKDGSLVDVSVGGNPGDPLFTVDDLLPHLAADQSKKPLGEAIPAESLNILVGSRPLRDDEGSDRVKLSVLELLNRKLIEMGALCEDAISASMHTLKNETDKQSAEKAAALEREIDHKEREIESLCMKLLLQQQPVARDLRTISSALSASATRPRTSRASPATSRMSSSSRARTSMKWPAPPAAWSRTASTPSSARISARPVPSRRRTTSSTACSTP